MPGWNLSNSDLERMERERPVLTSRCKRVSVHLALELKIPFLKPHVLVEPLDRRLHRHPAAWLGIDTERISGQQNQLLRLASLAVSLLDRVNGMNHVASGAGDDADFGRGAIRWILSSPERTR